MKLSVQVRWTTGMTPHVSLKIQGHVFSPFQLCLGITFRFQGNMFFYIFHPKKGCFSGSYLIIQDKRQQKIDNEDRLFFL